MLAKTIHILWHGKEAVYSVECEPGKNRSDTRVATCGGDGSVRVCALHTVARPPADCMFNIPSTDLESESSRHK